MNKVNEFTKTVTKFQCATSENLESILSYIQKDESVTFFSWKMFKLDDLKFDTVEAEKWLGREKRFIEEIKNLNIKFKYIKLIPDELPIYFYDNEMIQAKDFADQVKIFFSKLAPCQSILITDILKKPDMGRVYNLVFNKVYKDFSKLVDSSKYEKEVEFRGDPEIAKRAFCLFAAESAVIYSYFKNPVLLAGQRSIDTYKYEFFKYPSTRPVLPKLFVI